MFGSSMCLCSPEVPFEDFRPEAQWMRTVDAENPIPWGATPTILRSILCPPNMPSFLKVDLFHTLQMGVYREFVAGALCLLLPVFGKSSQEANMLCMSAKLQEFLKLTKQRLHCQRLTLGLIGADSPNAFSVGSWSKGADSTVLMSFTEWLVQDIVVNFQSERPFKYIFAGASAIHCFMRILYAEGAFLPGSVGVEASSHAQRFLLCYSKLAEFGVERKLLLFNLTPKLHYLHHVCFDLVEGGACRNLAFVSNPLSNSTSQCEDFIGQIARLSRRVSPRKIHSRVLRRYLAAVADHLGLLG